MGALRTGTERVASGFEEAALVNFAMPANACPSGDSGMENISVTIRMAVILTRYNSQKFNPIN
jgi:hypothetical protein